MIRAYVKINDLNDIVKLNKASAACKCKMAIYSGVKILNPKSLIMLFELSMGSTFPLVAKINDHETEKDFLEKFKGLIVSYVYY